MRLRKALRVSLSLRFLDCLSRANRSSVQNCVILHCDVSQSGHQLIERTQQIFHCVKQVWRSFDELRVRAALRPISDNFSDELLARVYPKVSILRTSPRTRSVLPCASHLSLAIFPGPLGKSKMMTKPAKLQ